MNFEQLQEKIGDLNRDEWHQHLNGGGWVHKKSLVLKKAFIGENAIIFGGTIYGGTIYGGIIHGGIIYGGIIHGGTIYGGTIYGGTIYGGIIHGGTIHGGIIHGGIIHGGTIRGGTIYGGIIYGGTIRGGTIRGGTIYGGTIYGGTIYDGEWKTSTLQIKGTRHFFNVSSPNTIDIGCISLTFDEWLEKYEEIGKKNKYTEEEIKEYKRYIDLAIKMYHTL